MSGWLSNLLSARACLLSSSYQMAKLQSNTIAEFWPLKLMRTLDEITRHRRKELMMTSQRSGMGLREELERLLANNSLSLLGSEARTNGQEQTPRQQQHQTIQEERLALFRPSSVRPRPGPTTTSSSTAATPGPSASASYSLSRPYGPAAGGRGRSMPL